MAVEHATLGILVLTLCMLLPVWVGIRRTRQGHQLFVRRIKAVDAVDEACGRAAEMGRPVSFSSGLTGISPVLYACLGVLFHVAKKAATFRSKLLVPQNDAQVLAVTEDVVRDAYRESGRLSSFDPKQIQFLSDEQFAFAAGYMGLVQRERIGSAFLLGNFAAESLMLAEAGQQMGAMQIAGTVNPEQVPFFICTCDYTMIGEELFGASAYLTREPVQLGSLYGQDRAKLMWLVLILAGTLVATWNSMGEVLGWPVIPNLEQLIIWKAW
ncbi:MAG: hypothetical protein QY326_04970 [Bdellovibrionota bacterium]|nr:MAG: hypothetical protein QY326_04970 [Bdellovibrionota bacterium]